MEKDEIFKIVNVVTPDVLTTFSPACPTCGTGVRFGNSNRTVCEQCGREVWLVSTDKECHTVIAEEMSTTVSDETKPEKTNETEEVETHEIVDKKELGSEGVFYWFAGMFATVSLLVSSGALILDMIGGAKNFESIMRIPIEEFAIKAPIGGFGMAAVFMVLGRICKALGLDLSDADEEEDEEEEETTQEVGSTSQKTLNMGR